MNLKRILLAFVALSLCAGIPTSASAMQLSALKKKVEDLAKDEVDEALVASTSEVTGLDDVSSLCSQIAGGYQSQCYEEVGSNPTMYGWKWVAIACNTQTGPKVMGKDECVANGGPEKTVFAGGSSTATDASKANSSSVAPFQAGKFLRLISNYDALIAGCRGARDQSYRSAAFEVVSARQPSFLEQGMKEYDADFARFFRSTEGAGTNKKSSACTAERLTKKYENQVARFRHLHPRFESQ